MAPKVIFLNGPPRCGKDTAARAIEARWPARVVPYKMMGPVEDHFRLVWRIDDATWLRLRERDKDVPQDIFAGKSLRQAFIAYSEEYMKPQFGSDIFGRLCGQRLGPLSSDAIVVISDSGFAPEAVPVLGHFGVGDCLRVEIHRPGHTFDGDSRSYWSLPGLQSLRVDNDGAEHMFAKAVVAAIEEWLK